jgi:putative ABC transport system substrate-binding protein
MKRRAFIKLLGGSVVAWPLAARAQPAGKVPTVGVLMAGVENSTENAPRISAFQKALAELGWKDGENIRLIYRWSTGKRELIDQYAKELVALKPDVIVANGTPIIATFQNLTSSIPVVFALSMDPVGLGQVKSLAHPGGNFTGFTFVDPELVGKWMQFSTTWCRD